MVAERTEAARGRVVKGALKLVVGIIYRELGNGSRIPNLDT